MTLRPTRLVDLIDRWLVIYDARQEILRSMRMLGLRKKRKGGR